VVSVDYTLSSADRHLWDVTQAQIGCALGWIVANAPRHGGDPTRPSGSGRRHLPVCRAGADGSIGEQAYRQLTARWLRDHGQSP
jgi:hypothetical protein